MGRINVICSVCKKTFPKEINKYFSLVPDICGSECYVKLIRRSARKPDFKYELSLAPVYRSNVETQYAEWLRENGFGFGYEKVKFSVIVPGRSEPVTYVPDFIVYSPVTKRVVIVEIKGGWTKHPQDTKKLYAFASQSITPFHVVDKDLIGRMIRK